MLLPDAAIQQHIAILGKTGSGKTTAAKVALVEPLLEQGRRVAVVDPTGAWWGLRSSRDGTGAGFPILVLGGDHGDLPLPALGGAAVARLLVEQGVNLVADTSALTVGERTRWFIDFASTVHRLNRTPLHLVLDESHNFAPQGKVLDPDAGKMLHAAIRLAAEGRSRGIRLAMITQRPQKLHKDALTSADTLIAMRVLAPQDRAAVEDWVKGCGDLSAGKEVLNSLASLQRGEGWVWYPEGGHLKRVKFPPIRTFDSSATPTEGRRIAAPKQAAEIDLTEIKAALADAVKQAEENDPKLLRRRIAELEALAARAKPAAAAAGIPEAEVQRRIREAVAAVPREAPPVSKALIAGVEKIAAGLQAVQGELAGVPAEIVPRARTIVRAPSQREAAPAPGPVSSGVSAPQQRILDALAWFMAIGVPDPRRSPLGAVAGSSPKSSGFEKNLSTLRTAGLIDYPDRGRVVLTVKGRGLANFPSAKPTEQALHDAIFAMVSGPQGNLLRVLIEERGNAIDRAELARRADVSAASSGFEKNISTLRSFELIDYPSRGMVCATDILFPKGK